MPKKNILFLFNKFPYPVIGGDKIKVYNLGKILSKYFYVDLVCINEANRGVSRLSREPFRNITCFNYPSLRFRWNAFLGIPSSLPLQAHYYRFAEVQKFIDANLDKYDLVFCHLLRMAPYVINKKIPKVIDLADSLAVSYQRFGRVACGLWKILYQVDAPRLARYELKIVEEFDRVFLVNQKEKDFLLSHGAEGEKLKVITNGVDASLISREIPQEENKEIIFFARLAAFHNEDAVVYFAREVWPAIRRERQDVKFVVIGADPTGKISGLKRIPGIEVCGYMAQPYERIDRAMLCVFPMRVAAGVQNKILESMALAKAVVATPVAVEAINGVNGKHFVVAGDKAGLVREVLRLLGDRELRREIGYNARQLIKEQYTWLDYEERLVPEIEGLLKP